MAQLYEELQNPACEIGQKDLYKLYKNEISITQQEPYDRKYDQPI